MIRRNRLSVLVLSLLVGASPLHAEEKWMFDPTFREGGPGDVLVARGSPLLLRAQVDAFVDLFEAAFDLALPAAAEQRLRDACETAFAAANEKDRRAFLDLVAPLSAIRHRARQEGPAVLLSALEAFRHALDGRLTAAPEAAPHPVLLGLLRLRQETSWPGSPPIHRSAADAWLEMVDFVASVGRNQKVGSTSGQRDQVRRDAGATLRAAETSIRHRLRDIHRPWLRLKARWDAARPPERLALRWRLVELVNRALPEAQRITVESAKGDLVAYARAAAALARTQSAYEAWSNLVRHPQPVLAAIDAWLGPVEGGADHVLLYR